MLTLRQSPRELETGRPRRVMSSYLLCVLVACGVAEGSCCGRVGRRGARAALGRKVSGPLLGGEPSVHHGPGGW